MKQTSVEWLLEQLEPNILWTEKAKKLAEQAKEMEKQQVINAYNIGFIYPIKIDFKNNKSQDGEQYYNETYENE